MKHPDRTKEFDPLYEIKHMVLFLTVLERNSLRLSYLDSKKRKPDQIQFTILDRVRTFPTYARLQTSLVSIFPFKLDVA